MYRIFLSILYKNNGLSLIEDSTTTNEIMHTAFVMNLRIKEGHQQRLKLAGYLYKKGLR